MAQASSVAPRSISAGITNAAAIEATHIPRPASIDCWPYAAASLTSPPYCATSAATEAATAVASGHPRCWASRSQVCACSLASPSRPANSSTDTASGSAVEVTDISRCVARTASRACCTAPSRSRPAAASSMARLACSCGLSFSPLAARACIRASSGRVAGRVSRSQRAVFSIAASSAAAAGPAPGSASRPASMATASANRPHSASASLSARAIAPRWGQSGVPSSAPARCPAAVAGSRMISSRPSSNSTSARSLLGGGSASARSRHSRATSGAPRPRASAAAARSRSVTQELPVLPAASRCTVTSSSDAPPASSSRAARPCQCCRSGGAMSW